MNLFIPLIISQFLFTIQAFIPKPHHKHQPWPNQALIKNPQHNYIPNIIHFRTHQQRLQSMNDDIKSVHAQPNIHYQSINKNDKSIDCPPDASNNKNVNKRRQLLSIPLMTLMTTVLDTQPSHARGLVQFPCKKGLANTYHFLRVGQTMLEEEGMHNLFKRWFHIYIFVSIQHVFHTFSVIQFQLAGIWSTNPLFLTVSDFGL
jgi:hypothetical protein